MNKRTISLNEAADILNVSTATVNNWIRSGLIVKSGRSFSYESVAELRLKIIKREIKKLHKRANRLYSAAKSLIPVERSDNDTNFQASKTIGKRSREGSFYTPDSLIKEILKDYSPKKGSVICDPCCGTGKFLKQAIKIYGSENIIIGYDTDPGAVEISKISLNDFGNNRICLEYHDSLLCPENEVFDYIFTNPPWGARYTRDIILKLKKLYPEACSSDSFEYFLHYGYRSLKNEGILSYLLPESILYVRKFSRLREFLLRKTKILKIQAYGRIFPDVFSKTVRIDLMKSIPNKGHKIILGQGTADQVNFLLEPGFRFNIDTSEQERMFLENVFKKPHVNLKGRAVWSLGIVTGDNKRFIRDEKVKDFFYEAVSGKNIDRYRISGKSKFLYKDFSKFQQVPKKDLFQVQEKLIYRFISEKLVFAYDSSGKYTTNSANILIPHIDGYTIKSVMAVLNSDLMNFIYRKKFNSLKVLRTNLEFLPFPENPDRKIINLIDDKTSCIINSNADQGKIRSEIEELVMKLFGVNYESAVGYSEKKIL